MKSPAISLDREAPDFELLDDRGQALLLRQRRGRRVLVLFFRGHW